MNEIDEYINQKKHLQIKLLNYIDNDNKDNFSELADLLNTLQLQKNHNELRAFLHLVCKISKNHYRYYDFFEKIEQILLYISKDIKQFLSNAEIFYIFKNCKRIILFLIETKILILDDSIIKLLMENKNIYYFFPEVKSHLNDTDLTKITNSISKHDNFDEKRKIGENDSEICFLIRTDSIDKFIEYTKKNNLSLSETRIKPSIFETNSFLLDKNPTLIEYASFYGSIQIFNYIQKNNVQLTSSLWLYSIHSNKIDLIHILEKNRIKPDDVTYNECLKESIKCHQNEITNHIKNDLIELKNSNDNENLISYSFHYFNYFFIPENFLIIKNEFVFNLLCENDYFEIVKFLLKSNKSKLITEKSLHLAAEKNNYNIVYLLLSQEENNDIKQNAFKKCNKLTQIEIPSNLKKIGNGSFYGCKSLHKLTIPTSITTIDDYAFYECLSLTEIQIPSSITVIQKGIFKGCSSLKKITLPSTITKIEDFAFYECSSLIEISIPNSVTSIGTFSFCKCSSLQKITIPTSITSIDQNSFSLCNSIKQIKIPSSITTIDDFLFNLCSNLIEVILPNSLISIGNRSFNGCKNLIQISIPSTVNSIGENAFNGCFSLKEISIPSSITIIKKYCFCGCFNLSLLVIPDSVTVIEDFAFDNCRSLVSISLPSKIKIIARNTFSGCSSLAQIEIPSLVRSIGTSAFEGCKSLNLVLLPKSLKSIGNFCFKNCCSLEEIDFPVSFKSVGYSAFEGCSSLFLISIPYSVELDETGIDENVEVDRF